MQKIIPLDAVSLSRFPSRNGVRSGAGGCVAGSCESRDGASELTPDVWNKVKDHPCYNREAHHFFARMHVAVAPACNIQCNYCNRKYDCANESRPGVVSEQLTPELAARKVLWVASQMPQLSVVGIAGPGDALADPRKTLETCERISDALPDIKLCLSTNGLMLPEWVDAIKTHAIDHVTITINAIDPDIAEHIYAWVAYDKRRLTGRSAARLLIERQLLGLEMLVAAGTLVKVNSVMIPGINDTHLKELNTELKVRGVFLHNIMPLISDPAHGTHFGLIGQRGPTAAELKSVQNDLADGANLMKHCRQCRADAIGLLGDDQGRSFGIDRLPETAVVDHESRRNYRAVIDRERKHRKNATAIAAADLRDMSTGDQCLFAVCTKGGGRINQHFGHAREFQIYEADRLGVRLAGHRRAAQYCQGGFGEDDALESTIALLDGVYAILCARVGDRPRTLLSASGIRVIDDYAHEYIETAVAKVFVEHFGVVQRTANTA
ncbi:MAG: nitrogenase cofactor biosynthesis protein NifB [Rhodospirillales bacterium]|nr:nitrogenase cofactor biosynthesis protein NifB [Rhodospirillales bacterium]